MKLFRGVLCVTSNKLLDFGGNLAHVTLGFGLQLHRLKFVLSRCSCVPVIVCIYVTSENDKSVLYHSTLGKH